MLDKLGRVTCRECSSEMRLSSVTTPAELDRLETMLLRYACDECDNKVEYVALTPRRAA